MPKLMEEASMNSRPPFRLTFRVSVTVVLVATVLAMALVTVTIALTIGAEATRRNAETLFSRIAESVAESAENQLAIPVTMARAAVLDPQGLVPIEGSGRLHPFYGYLWGILLASPSLRSVSLGSADGTLLQLIRTDRDADLLSRLQAPAGTRFLLRTISGSEKTRSQVDTFLADGQIFLGRRNDPNVDFAPRSTPWFQNARQTVIVSEPYRLDFNQRPGVSISAAFPGGLRVLGMELSLDGLQTFVDQRVVSSHAGIEVLGAAGLVLARSQGFEEKADWFKKTFINRIFDQEFQIVLTAPRSDFGGEFRTTAWAVIVATGVLLLILLPLTLGFTRRLTRIITILSQDVEMVCRLDFSGEAPQSSRIKEFDQLARAFAIMKSTLSSETQILADAQLKLKKIVETGIALSTEKDSNALCQKILDTAKELTDADGGTLYLLNEKERILDFNIMLNDTLGTRFGGTSGQPIPPGLKVNLYRDDGEENHHNVASHAFLTGETINITNAYNDQRFDFSGTRKFDEANGYRSKSFLTVPLKPLGGEVLGALQLINARQKGYFTSDMQSFVEALSASAATALY